ncbi:MAG: alpha/beta hydrolase [Rhodobacteraceae bacterium]|nr:MAG: alpha/beta hydrolase [Paracoccaceae bacterium]
MSRRLRLLNALLRGVCRPFLKRTKSPERARRDFDIAARVIFRGPRGSSSRRAIGGVPALEVRPTGSADAPVLLYFHGGGYIAGSARSHLPMVGHLASAAGIRTVIPDYRLAPDNPFPAAFEDALAVWSGLLSEGVAANQIVLGGDSAGGGLALALMARLLQTGDRPAGLFAFSPWTDLSCGGASLVENADRDAILPVERIRELRGMVAPDSDPKDPRLSPLFAVFDGAPPVYLQVSESEILRDDTLALASRLEGSGVDTRVDTWPDAPHVWQIFCGWVPEADEALDRAAEFIRSRIKVSPPRSES